MLGKYRHRDAKRLVNRAEKDIDTGIGVVQTFMQRRAIGDSRRGLYIVRDALVEADQRLVDEAQPIATHQEIPGYHYGIIEEGKTNRDQPAPGQADHGCDAMRYAMMWLWRKNGAPRKVEGDFEVGTWADVLGHKRFLKELARRERRLGT